MPTLNELFEINRRLKLEMIEVGLLQAQAPKQPTSRPMSNGYQPLEDDTRVTFFTRQPLYPRGACSCHKSALCRCALYSSSALTALAPAAACSLILGQKINCLLLCIPAIATACVGGTSIVYMNLVDSILKEFDILDDALKNIMGLLDALESSTDRQNVSTLLPQLKNELERFNSKLTFLHKRRFSLFKESHQELVKIFLELAEYQIQDYDYSNFDHVTEEYQSALTASIAVQELTSSEEELTSSEQNFSGNHYQQQDQDPANPHPGLVSVIINSFIVEDARIKYLAEEEEVNAAIDSSIVTRPGR